MTFYFLSVVVQCLTYRRTKMQLSDREQEVVSGMSCHITEDKRHITRDNARCVTHHSRHVSLFQRRLQNVPLSFHHVARWLNVGFHTYISAAK